jgi:hypothetical protein
MRLKIIRGKYVVGSIDMPDKSLGLTPKKKYIITYEGKDEIEVLNDFGVKEAYSMDFFEYYK